VRGKFYAVNGEGADSFLASPSGGTTL